MGTTPFRAPHIHLLMASILVVSVAPAPAATHKTAPAVRPSRPVVSRVHPPVAMAAALAPNGAAVQHTQLSSLPVGKAKSRITMDFRDAPIDQILNFYSVVSGLTVIKDPGLTGTGTLISLRPITIDTAIVILGALVDTRGYRMDRTSTMLKIAPKGQGGGGPGRPGFGGPGAGGPSVGGTGPGGTGAGGPGGAASGAPGASGPGGPGGGAAGFGGAGGGRSREQTQVFTLKYANAKSVTSIVNDLFKNAVSGGGSSDPSANPAGGGAARTASTARASSDDYSNSVIVTGPPDQLTQVSNMIDEIDQPVGSTQITQVFKIKYLDAQSASTVVSNVLLASSKNGANSGAAGGVPQDQRAMMSARFGASSATNGQVAVLAEINSLVVTASAESLDLVQKVLVDLDQPQKIQSTVFVRNLKNASASDVAQLLNQMYGRSGANTSALNTRTNTGFGVGSSRTGTGLGTGSRTGAGAGSGLGSSQRTTGVLGG